MDGELPGQANFFDKRSEQARILSLGMKKEWILFVLLSFFRNFAIRWMANLLSLGMKKEWILFVLLSFFRNFAYEKTIFR